MHLSFFEWSSPKPHRIGIAGSHHLTLDPSGPPRNHADRLLSAEVQAQATRHLEAATRAAKGNPRVVAEVELDAAAFANWVTLAEEARRGGTTHDLKLIREEDAFNTVGWLKAKAKKGKPQMTRFKLYRGTKALHLLAECEEKENPAFDRGTTKNDAHNWGSPSIEIFLDAGDGGSRQIAFSPAGGVWDAKDGDVSWNSGATVRTTFEADKWLLEAEIPYEGIGVNPASGDRWKIMIIRNPGGGSKFSGAGWPVNAHRDYGSAATLVFK